MRTLILRAATTVAALTLPTGAVYAGPGYTAPTRILVIAPRDNSVDLYLSTASPMGCSFSGWFRLFTSAANYNSIYSLLLTQYSSGGTVLLFSNSCDTDGSSIIVAARAPS